MNKLIVIILGGILLSGCTAKYKAEDVTKNSERLVPNTKVLIAQPENGSYESTLYSHSGFMTAQAVLSAFGRHSDDTSVLKGCAVLECLTKNQQMSNGYYVIPQILHWEDRATEWSGIPDKIEVKISIYSASTGNIIASRILKGSSKWLTFGGDHPQDLLPQLINSYVEELY